MTVVADSITGRTEQAIGRPVRRRAWLGQTARQILLPLAFAIAVFIAWEVAVRSSNISSMVIVPPSAAANVLLQHYPILLQHAIPTLRETVIGFALASFLGIVLGTAIASSERMRQAIYPNMVLFQVIPKVALAPLFIVWLGVGSSSRITFAVFIAFFPVAVSTAAGLASTNRTALRLCQSLTATATQTFFAVRLPYAVPYIFAGLKVGVTMAVIGIVIGEFVTAQAGLGYLVMFASSAAETALALAAIFLLCVIGMILYGLVALAEFLTIRRLGAPLPAGDTL